MTDAKMPKQRALRMSDELQEFLSELLAGQVPRNAKRRAMSFVKRQRQLEGMYEESQAANERKSDQLRRLSGSKRAGRRSRRRSRKIAFRHIDNDDR